MTFNSRAALSAVLASLFSWVLASADQVISSSMRHSQVPLFQVLSVASEDSKFLDITAQYVPEAGSQVVLSCYLGLSSGRALPFMDRFELLVSTGASAPNSLECATVVFDKGSRTAYPIPYDIMVPVATVPSEENPSVVVFRIETDRLVEAANGAVGDGEFSISLRFTLTQCRADGLRIEARKVETRPFRLKRIDGRWLLNSTRVAQELSALVRLENGAAAHIQGRAQGTD